ncbi:MAG: response regulator [Chitinophagaceae bacterium]
MPRILMIDDDADEQGLFAETVEELGLPEKIQLHFCSNGLESLTLLEHTCPPPFDLILLDMNMPLMNGVEFLKRTYPRLADFTTELMGFSTTNNPDIISEFKAYGASGFVTKPSDLRKYEEVVARFTDRARENYHIRKKTA